LARQAGLTLRVEHERARGGRKHHERRGEDRNEPRISHVRRASTRHPVTTGSANRPGDDILSPMAGEAVRTRPKIYSIAIETTAYCNQKCDYCYNEWRAEGALGGGGRDKLLARAKKLVDQFEIDHVTLTGGEPFAQP